MTAQCSILANFLTSHQILSTLLYKGLPSRTSDYGNDDYDGDITDVREMLARIMMMIMLMMMKKATTIISESEYKQQTPEGEVLTTYPVLL